MSMYFKQWLALSLQSLFNFECQHSKLLKVKFFFLSNYISQYLACTGHHKNVRKLASGAHTLALCPLYNVAEPLIHWTWLLFCFVLSFFFFTDFIVCMCKNKGFGLPDFNAKNIALQLNWLFKVFVSSQSIQYLPMCECRSIYCSVYMAHTSPFLWSSDVSNLVWK